MAIADIPPGGPPRRLDSWKEIAEYLRRDVRTATRWEAQGLPLHRVAGGKGRSVFAFTNEIDAWMASHPAESEADVVVVEPSPVPQALEASRRPRRTISISVACAVVVIGIGAAVMSSGPVTPMDQLRPVVTVTASHVSTADAAGVARIIHQFSPGASLAGPWAHPLHDLDADGVAEVVVGLAGYESGGRLHAGELLSLSTGGLVHWRFKFDDGLSFARRSLSGPWLVTDWQVEPGVSLKRIAIAAHEERWWASVVSVLDHTGSRLGTFVNPGWIESVLWRS